MPLENAKDWFLVQGDSIHDCPCSLAVLDQRLERSLRQYSTSYLTIGGQKERKGMAEYVRYVCT